MQPIKSSHAPRTLTSLLLVFSLCSGILISNRANAQKGSNSGSSGSSDSSGSSGSSGSSSNSSKKKVGADLDKRIREAPDSFVKVIVQPNGSWSSSLDTDLKSKGATIKPAYKNITARAVYMKARDVNTSSVRSDVTYISLDRDTKKLGHVTLTTGADAARSMGGSTKYDGTGIGIAVLDSGIDPNHAAFKDANGVSRITANVDFTGEKDSAGLAITNDPYGHGSHVASIAAGNGNVSQGAYEGIASNAKIINLRVLNSQGVGSVSTLLSALDWVMTNRTTYNIKVVNMSLGTPALDSYRDDPACKAVRRLVDLGIVAVAAAGNEGKDGMGRKLYGLIHSPGVEPSVITVGSANSFGTDSRSDDGIASYSSRGPTRGFWTDVTGIKHYDNLVKPDVVAPGNKIIDAQSPGNYLVTNNPTLDANVSGSGAKEQMFMSGTSMATPVVAGAAAMLLQANSKLTPNLVKAILMYTAQPLAGFNNFEQGAGEINLEGAMRLAKLIRTDLSSSTPLGAPLLCSTCTAPTAQTTIADFSFNWGQGLIMDYTFATGVNLITEYQKIYALGVLIGDGTLESNGVLIGDGVMIGDGVIFGDSILTSNGMTLSQGTYFCGTGVMLGDGVMIGDGIIFGDGVMIGDGVLISDGVMLGDVAAQASKAMLNGDNTASMRVVVDVSIGAPTSLTASAASSSQINLAWADNASNESGFKIERSTDGTNFTQIATVGVNVRAYSSTGLSANKKYYYRVRAYNGSNNSSYSNSASATTRR